MNDGSASLLSPPFHVSSSSLSICAFIIMNDALEDWSRSCCAVWSRKKKFGVFFYYKTKGRMRAFIFLWLVVLYEMKFPSHCICFAAAVFFFVFFFRFPKHLHLIMFEMSYNVCVCMYIFIHIRCHSKLLEKNRNIKKFGV